MTGIRTISTLAALAALVLAACDGGLTADGGRTDLDGGGRDAGRALDGSTPGRDAALDATIGLDGAISDGGTVDPCPIPDLPASAIDVTEAPYAATGDGVTDDTRAIQRAIDDAPAGGTVYVPPGTYLLSVTADVKHSLHIRTADLTFQMAEGAVLKLGPNGNTNYELILVEADNIQIFGGTLVGDRDEHTGTGGEWGMGILIRRSNHVTIVGVSARDMWGDGFMVGDNASREPPRDIHLCRVLADNNRRQGITVSHAEGVLIEWSVFSNTGGTLPEAGIDLEPDHQSDGLDTHISDVTIRDSEFFGNRIGVKACCGAREVSVIRAHAHDNREHGILISNRTDNVMTTEPVSIDVSVTACRSEHNGRSGLHVAGLGVTVEDNELTHNGEDGIYNGGFYRWIDGDDESNVYRNNHVADNAESGIVVAYSNECTVEGNTVERNGQNGIELHVANRNRIMDNHVTSSSESESLGYDNVALSRSDHNHIEGTVARAGTDTNRPAFGIRVSDAASDANEIVDNDLVGGGVTGGWLDNGTDTVMTGNTE